MENFPNLKRVPKKPYKPTKEDMWSLDNLKDGLNYFKKINGRYPSANEVDDFEHLPSAKTIQRRFGGLIELRKVLGLEGPSNFGAGAARSLKSTEIVKRARTLEEGFYNFLTSKIPEIRVHEQKTIRPAYIRADYFVYTSESDGIIIDIFYAQDIKTALKVILLKQETYRIVEKPTLFIIVGNDQITQKELDGYMLNKKIPLAKNITALTESEFKRNFEKFIR